jgi:hypothetical protein
MKSFLKSVRQPLVRSRVLFAFVIAGLFAGAGIVSAATTISTDINTGGQLTVTGTSTFLGNVVIGTSTPWNNSLFSVGNLYPTLYVNAAQGPSGAIGIGTTTTAGFDLVVGDGTYGDGRLNLNGVQPFLEIQDVDDVPDSYVYGRKFDLQAYYGMLRLVEHNTDAATTSVDFGIANGDFGIGLGNSSTAVPVNRLDVNGSAAIGTTNAGVNIAPTNGLLVQGKVGIATTSPVANFQVANGSNSTTTVELGSAGQNKGTCLKLYRSDGSAIYASVAAGATTFMLSTTACATVTGF